MKKIGHKKIKKIELASQEKVEVYAKEIENLLKAMGHPEALVTDESLVSDFLDIFDKQERIKQIEKIKKKIKIDVFPGDFLWEVAKRMREHSSIG